MDDHKACFKTKFHKRMPTRSAKIPVVPLNPELEHTLHRSKQIGKLKQDEIIEPIKPIKMTDNERNNERDAENTGPENDTRLMSEILAPHRHQHLSGIAAPNIPANTYEIKSGIIHLIQQTGLFGGEAHESPNDHLDRFLMCADTARTNGVPQDAARLKLFPFSLTGQALEWLRTLEPGSITTWVGLEKEFLSYYFPPSKTAMLRGEITSFHQPEHEALHTSWTRFRKMLRMCPHHDIPKHQLVSVFYHGLTPTNRAIVDSAAGGDLFRKIATEAYDMINELARKSVQWQEQKLAGPTRQRVFAVEEQEQNPVVADLSRKMDVLLATLSRPPTCVHCGGDHNGKDCQAGSPFAGDGVEMVNYVGGQPRYNQNYNNSNPNNYNSYNNNNNGNYRRPQHPNLSYGNSNQNVLRPPSGFVQEHREQGLGMPPYQQQNQGPMQPPKESDKVITLLKEISARLANNEAFCKDLSNQVAQINRDRQERPQGSLPSTTEKNPKILRKD
ncbi:uncharacterized protein [Euphorbia lathyris]|uniref:uncharacterized protein n=1 Tax=Euphorbia lathyris TaxID=212925 RepID=UPI003313A851